MLHGVVVAIPCGIELTELCGGLDLRVILSRSLPVTLSLVSISYCRSLVKELHLCWSRITQRDVLSRGWNMSYSPGLVACGILLTDMHVRLPLSISWCRRLILPHAAILIFRALSLLRSHISLKKVRVVRSRC